jgi:hypothetical protein
VTRRPAPSRSDEDRERDSDSGPSSIADVRVRVGRRDLHQIIRSAYSVSAILLWGLGGGALAWGAPKAAGAAVDLTAAINQASKVLETAVKSTERIEAATAAIQAEQRSTREEQRERWERVERAMRDCAARR